MALQQREQAAGLRPIQGNSGTGERWMRQIAGEARGMNQLYRIFDMARYHLLPRIVFIAQMFSAGPQRCCPDKEYV